jgi:hypothetical protein
MVVSSMSELRERIAAALYRTYPPYQLGYTFGCPTENWEDESERCRDVYLRDADSLIRELGLQPHLAKRIINGKPDQWVRRHETDWEIVNE